MNRSIWATPLSTLVLALFAVLAVDTLSRAANGSDGMLQDAAARLESCVGRNSQLDSIALLKRGSDGHVGVIKLCVARDHHAACIRQQFEHMLHSAAERIVIVAIRRRTDKTGEPGQVSAVIVRHGVPIVLSEPCDIL